jgi:hypothetical protein
VEHQITQFLFYFLMVIPKDGIAKLIGFFYGEMAKGLQGLFFIPRTFGPDFIHDIEQMLKCFDLFRP